MNNSGKIKWITSTAVFIALLVAFQYATKPMGQYVTGSAVNFILVMSVLAAGFTSGITVAALSPVFAFMLGIGPAFVQMVPFVMLGNIVLVVVWGLICRGKADIKNMAVSTITGAVLKFAALYLTIVKYAVPHLLQLQNPQAAVVSASFSYPQLVTALIGGIVASVAAPLILKALKR